MLDIKQKWFSLDDKIRFVIIGCINAGISYLIFALCLFIFGDSLRQLCVALQWIISSVFSYLNQKFFVFNTRGNYVKEYLKCCSTWFVSYLLNVLILELLVKFCIKNVLVSQFISLLTVSIVTATVPLNYIFTILLYNHSAYL